mgnify:CR=1 FL=1
MLDKKMVLNVWWMRHLIVIALGAVGTAFFLYSRAEWSDMHRPNFTLQARVGNICRYLGRCSRHHHFVRLGEFGYDEVFGVRVSSRATKVRHVATGIWVRKSSGRSCARVRGDFGDYFK